jgi:hypothetical protein
VGFDDGGVGEATGLAHHLEPVADVVLLEGVEQRRLEPGTRRPEGVAEGDGTAVDVDLAEVGSCRAGPRQHDRRERLVDLEQVDVGDGQTGPAQHLLGGGDDRGEHEERVVGLDHGGVHPGPGT